MNYSKNLFTTLLFSFSLTFSFAQKQPFSCGVNDSNLSESTINAMRMAPQWLKQKQARKSANELYICRIGVDIDSDTYNSFGRDTTLIKYEVLKRIERISKVYEAEINTQLVVTYIKIWTNPDTDPYKKSQDSFAHLYDIERLWSSSPYNTLPVDKAMLLSTKFGGGVAYVPGKFSVSGFINDQVIAHELGHNFGSPHTQNCYWQGGPLDFCVSSEGDCYEEALESSKGSIMSYCGVAGLFFHPLCQAVMQNHAEKSFSKISSISPPPSLPTNGFDFESSRSFLFNSVPSAELYEYQVSQSKDFTKDVYNDSTDINAFTYPNYKKNNVYYIRVRAKNRAGISEWSNVISITVPDLKLQAPTLKTPLDNATNIDFSTDTKLTFDAVEGATQYELDISYSEDFRSFGYQRLSNVRTISNTNSFTINALQIPFTNRCYWRVRAINGDSKSAWSETRRFFAPIGEYSINFTPSRDLNNLSTAFFVNSYTGNYEYDTKVSVFQLSDLSKPVFEKILKPNKYPLSSVGSILVDKLNANTNYVLKVESINSKADLSYDIPTGVIRTSSRTFKTGSENGLLGWQVFNGNTNTPNLSKQLNFYEKFGVNAKNLFITSEEGLVKLQFDSLKSTVYNRDNTKGQLSNRINRRIDVDSVGNVWIVVPLSKNVIYNSNVVTSDYALRQFDGQTMKLLSSQQIEFENNLKYINFFDVHNKFFSDGSNIMRLEGNKGRKIIDFIGGYYREMTSSKTDIWFSNNYENNAAGAEIKRFNIQNQKLTTFNKTTVPALGESNEVKILTDNNNNLWALVKRSFYSTSILKFDGNNWTEYNSNNSPLKFVGDMFVDKLNNVYVNSAPNSNSDDVTVMKFNGKEWKDITKIRMNISYSNKIFCDGFGKIWEQIDGSSILRYDPCPQMPKPIISSSLPYIELNKNTVLEAKGCTNVIWNWKNKEENVYEKLVLGTSKIEVSPKSATTYYARCVDEGCSGQENSFNLGFVPVLFTNRVIKNEFCQNDTLKISPKIEGNFDNNNQFSAILSSSQGKFTFPLVNNKTNYLLPPNSKLLSGKYWLKLEGSSPKVVSKDSIEITILSIPTVNITGNNSFCKGQSTNLISTVSGGTSPYVYQWQKDLANINSTSNALTVSNAGSYKVSVTDSKGCSIASAVYSVTQNEYPVVTITKNGSTDIFQNTSVKLSVPTIANQTIQWLKDGVAISGATNDSYTVTQPGNYKVSVSVNGCTTISEGITVNLITSNEPNLEDNVKLKVFPNPNEGSFTVEFNSIDLKPTELIISDILGRTILRKTIKFIGKYSQQINISEQSSGQFFISVQKDDGVKTIKMIKK
jgi:Metallo-peptidase family M12/Secretion system C-terminal sorting domain